MAGPQVRALVLGDAAGEMGRDLLVLLGLANNPVRIPCDWEPVKGRKQGSAMVQPTGIKDLSC